MAHEKRCHLSIEMPWWKTKYGRRIRAVLRGHRQVRIQLEFADSRVFVDSEGSAKTNKVRNASGNGMLGGEIQALSLASSHQCLQSGAYQKPGRGPT